MSFAKTAIVALAVAAMCGVNIVQSIKIAAVEREQKLGAAFSGVLQTEVWELRARCSLLEQRHADFRLRFESDEQAIVELQKRLRKGQ